MKKCPYCAEDIQDEAIVCKHCGRELGTQPLTIAQPAPVEKKKSNNALLVILVLIILIIVLCAIASGSRASQKAAETPDDGSSSAFYACTEFSKNYLVSPKSADFPRYNKDYVTNLSGGEFLVSTYVDSKNKLGVDIRSNLICKVAHEGDKWRLVDIKIE